MQIAIVGTGAIGSTFAFHLAKAGHAVTVIARGTRLAQLQRDNALVLVTGERAPVQVCAALDTATPWDLVLVTVLAPQVDAVLPALQASAAQTIMFMFNTFEPLDRLREAVGAARFAFGFPAILALLPDGKLKHDIYTRGQRTIVTEPAWAKVFTDAGISTWVENDMHSWLRTHAALVSPLMALSTVVHARGAGVSWSEARAYALALAAGFRIVEALGNKITPPNLGTLSRLPTPLLTSVLWTLSRTKLMRELGVLGPGEARMLIDSMAAAAPDQAAEVRAIRP